MNRVWLALVILLATGAASEPVDADEADFQAPQDMNRLTSMEENLAYSAKGPAERVSIFLNIANRKIESARKIIRSNSNNDLESSLRGYLPAMKGARMGVCWGQSIGLNMRPQQDRIDQMVRKHRIKLAELEKAATGEPRSEISRIRLALEKQLVEERADSTITSLNQ